MTDTLSSARVLIVHNAYQHRGGEDAVVEAESELLVQHGHAVRLYGRHNDDVARLPRLTLALQTVWSGVTVDQVAAEIRAFRPDVIHVHNTFPLISPSLYWAAARLRVPVVQTLHNFRLLCPQAMFLREGRVCEDCLGHLPWRGVIRRCYRNSLTQTAVLAGMLATHDILGTFNNKIARYIALSEFSRGRFVAGGLPADKIAVKPNFVEGEMPGRGHAVLCDVQPGGSARSGFLFVGRLSPEKGVGVLARAISQLKDISLRVAGEGPDIGLLQGLSGVALHGFLPSDRVRAEMMSAQALVLPSICYENFPRSIVEAFSCGLPVIASRLGAMAELVREGETGLLFEPGNAEDLAAKLRWAAANPAALLRMGEAARQEHVAKYTPEINYRQLVSIYAEAITALDR